MLRRSFLPRAPEMKPRTLCACQPVARIRLVSVAPPERCSRATNLGLFGVFSACVRVLLARGLPGGLAPRRCDVARVFARDEALDSPPDPSFGYGAVGEPLDRRQTWNSVPDIDQAATGPIGSQLRKFFFAGELLAPLVGDFGCSAVSSDVVFRVDGEDRNWILLPRLRSSHPSLSGAANARQMNAAPSED